MRKAHATLHTPNSNLAGYINYMIENTDKPVLGKSYLPLVRLPQDIKLVDSTLQPLYHLLDN